MINYKQKIFSQLVRLKPTQVARICGPILVFPRRLSVNEVDNFIAESDAAYLFGRLADNPGKSEVVFLRLTLDREFNGPPKTTFITSIHGTPYSANALSELEGEHGQSARRYIVLGASSEDIPGELLVLSSEEFLKMTEQFLDLSSRLMLRFRGRIADGQGALPTLEQLPSLSPIRKASREHCDTGVLEPKGHLEKVTALSDHPRFRLGRKHNQAGPPGAN